MSFLLVPLSHNMKKQIIVIITSLLALSVSAKIPQATLAAAKNGNAVAQCDLGMEYYLIGEYKDAVHWFAKAAEQNNTQAQYNLGICYEKGQGVDMDILEAFFLYKTAAEKGLPEAQYMLAGCYKDGIGVQKNPDLACRWYKAAADQDYPLGCYEYAVNYLDKNSNDYRILLKRAASNGKLEKAFYPYAVCLLERSEAEGDDGLLWLKKAVDGGDACAMFYMANLYRDGKFVAQSDTKAFDLYCKASDLGNVDATFAKAECYEKGIGTTRNIDSALRNYKQIVSSFPEAKNKVIELDFDEYRKNLIESLLLRLVKVSYDGSNVSYKDEENYTHSLTYSGGKFEIIQTPITRQEFDAIVKGVRTSDSSPALFSDSEMNTFIRNIKEQQQLDLRLVSVGELLYAREQKQILSKNNHSYIVSAKDENDNDVACLFDSSSSQIKKAGRGYLFLYRDVKDSVNEGGNTTIKCHVKTKVTRVLKYKSRMR